MKKKLLALLGCACLFAGVMAGCGTDQNPPPEEDINVENPNQNGDLNDNMNDNGINDNSNDMNTENDKDMMKDHNDPGEDMIEDDLDAKDKDNIDR